MAAQVHTPVGDAPVIPLAMLTIGGYLAWFGIHYWRSDVTWPSDPVKAVLTGKPAPTAGHSATGEVVFQNLLATQAGTAQNAAQSSAGGGGAVGAPGAGGTYDHAALVQLWTSAGGSSSTANIAAAIAQAESSGRPAVTSPNPDGGTNVGLWQLDTRGVGAGYTVAQLSDPLTNARITVMGSLNGTNWRYWSTYTGGDYRRFLEVTV
jgi:Lysozyme like domain